jgi:hypothetical protein
MAPQYHGLMLVLVIWVMKKLRKSDKIETKVTKLEAKIVAMDAKIDSLIAAQKPATIKESE